MLAKNLSIIVTLVLAIPNIGMSGVMIGNFESTTSAPASTRDKALLPKDQNYWDDAPDMKGVVSSLVTNVSSNAIEHLTRRSVKTPPRLIFTYGLREWQFIHDPPAKKILKVPIDIAIDLSWFTFYWIGN